MPGVHPLQRALKGSYCISSSFLINSADALSRLPVGPPDNQDAIETKEYAFSIANEAVPVALTINEGDSPERASEKDPNLQLVREAIRSGD